VGINGKGELRFSGFADGVSAIQFAQGISTPSEARNITIRDLSIGYIDGGQNIGIDVSFASKMYIHNRQVTNFLLESLEVALTLMHCTSTLTTAVCLTMTGIL
jgi:hypothetical protein